jgi:hypothetical protein
MCSFIWKDDGRQIERLERTDDRIDILPTEEYTEEEKASAENFEEENCEGVDEAILTTIEETEAEKQANVSEALGDF